MRPPLYWAHETSGVLAPVVKAYLDGETLTVEDVMIMRAYLRQWIMSDVWDANPHAELRDKTELASLRSTVGMLHDRASITRWLDWASNEGIDPL